MNWRALKKYPRPLSVSSVSADGMTPITSAKIIAGRVSLSTYHTSNFNTTLCLTSKWPCLALPASLSPMPTSTVSWSIYSPIVLSRSTCRCLPALDRTPFPARSTSVPASTRKRGCNASKMSLSSLLLLPSITTWLRSMKGCVLKDHHIDLTDSKMISPTASSAKANTQNCISIPGCRN